MSSTPPPSTPEQGPSPGPPPPPRPPPGGAPDGPPSYEPTMANRIAAIGFTCSIGCLPVFALGVATEAGLLFAASGIMWLLGLGLSIAALSKQERPSPTHRRLAVAGIVIPVVSIIVIPILLVWALISFINSF